MQFTKDPSEEKKHLVAGILGMLRIRVLEEQLILLWKKGKSAFWTGGPGEEASQYAIGQNLQCGLGPDYDYFLPHYRNLGVILTLGEKFTPIIQQALGTQEDPYSGGKYFASHPAKKAWNIIPTSSPVATQCLVGIGTAMAQAKKNKEKKAGAKALSCVVIGEASSASPDFESSLIWSTLPQKKLPLLLIITNNRYGISTKTSSQITSIAERAISHQIPYIKGDGINFKKANLLVEQSFKHVRKTGGPMVLELEVSRVYGHSSSTGANFESSERCPIRELENYLLKKNWINKAFISEHKNKYTSEFRQCYTNALTENPPHPKEIWSNIFKGSS